MRQDKCSLIWHLLWTPNSIFFTFIQFFQFFKKKTLANGPIKLPTSTGSWKKQENFRKTSISALLTMPKPLTLWITILCWHFPSCVLLPESCLLHCFCLCFISVTGCSWNQTQAWLLCSKLNVQETRVDGKREMLYLGSRQPWRDVALSSVQFSHSVVSD